MMLANDLMIFRETQNPEVLGITGAEFDLDDINVISIEVLSWLKLEYKRELWIRSGKKTKLKPMRLNMNYSWCKAVVQIVSSCPSFARRFMVDGNELHFREDVGEDVRSEERRAAYDNYNPEKII